MSSEWIFTAIGLTFVFIGIPLVFLSVTLFNRLRTGWKAQVLWRSLRCPVKLTAVQVGFLETQDFLRNLKTVDAIYCSAFRDPCQLECGKECLQTTMIE
jgi:hypothetical protein